MSTLGAAHFAAALAALALGLVVLIERKGTLTHRLIGCGYVTAMILLNVTALGVYRLTGHFGPFHALALVSLATVIAGVAVVWRRRPNWLRRHYDFMAWSYVGLLAAACAESATRLPLLRAAIATGPQRIALGVAIAVLFAFAGWFVLPRLQGRALAHRGEAVNLSGTPRSRPSR
jgi:uncharacterized membrane protein